MSIGVSSLCHMPSKVSQMDSQHSRVKAVVSYSFTEGM